MRSDTFQGLNAVQKPNTCRKAALIYKEKQDQRSSRIELLWPERPEDGLKRTSFSSAPGFAGGIHCFHKNCIRLRLMFCLYIRLHTPQFPPNAAAFRLPKPAPTLSFVLAETRKCRPNLYASRPPTLIYAYERESFLISASSSQATVLASRAVQHLQAYNKAMGRVVSTSCSFKMCALTARTSATM